MLNRFFEYFRNNLIFKKQIKDEVIQQLGKGLVNINQTYPDINCGGCGVFAYELGVLLKERGIDSKVVWIQHFSSRRLRKEFNKVINTQPKKLFDIDEDIICSHIMLYIDGLYIDSTGVYKSFSNTDWGLCDYKILDYTTIDNIKRICNHSKGWNVTFKRKFISPIKKDLKKLVYNLDLSE